MRSVAHTNIRQHENGRANRATPLRLVAILVASCLGIGAAGVVVWVVLKFLPPGTTVEFWLVYLAISGVGFVMSLVAVGWLVDGACWLLKDLKPVRAWLQGVYALSFIISLAVADWLV